MTAVAKLLLALIAFAGPGSSIAEPLGLPPVPIPANNPMSCAKIALGGKLFLDRRFSSTGEVSCSTCHAPAQAFTDSPLQTSEGVHHLTGTRNAPTLANVAYMKRMFWDGRAKDLEDQSRLPFVNPVEMGCTIVSRSSRSFDPIRITSACSVTPSARSRPPSA